MVRVNLWSKRKEEKKMLSRRGMTLVEIMVVVVILGMIASAVGVAVFKQLKKAKESTACGQIKDFENALDLYKLEHGSYPASDQGLEVLVSEEILKAKAVPKDPWQHAYIFVSPGQHNATSYDIYSPGEDGRESEDDLNNWGPPCVK